MSAQREPWDHESIPAELMAVPEGVTDVGEMIDATEEFGSSISEAVEVMLDREPDRWRIVDDDACEWALRHVAEAEAELAALDERARRWQDQIAAWIDQAAREPARTAEWFKAHIEAYARRVRVEEDRKSVALPSGKVTTRLVPPAVEIVDEDALLAWARENAPVIIRVREDVQVSTVRENIAVERAAEVPGLAVRPERLSVKVDAT